MKKKKKTKKPFDMSLLEGNEETNEITAKETDSKGNDVIDEDITDLNDFSGLKKKKKKKKTFNLEDLDNALPDKENGKPVSPSDENQTPADEAENAVEDDLDFDYTKKKKKKKNKVNFDDIGIEPIDEMDASVATQDYIENEDGLDGQQSNLSSVLGKTPTNKWLETDRDYTYDELLEIVFNIIKEKNPELDAGTKKKLVMRPPQVLRVGTKKSSFANFLEICKSYEIL